MKLNDLKNGLNHWWHSVSDGWNKLGESAAGALTRFKPDSKSGLPPPDQISDKDYSPATGWAILAGNVFENERCVVVQLEIPGLDKKNANIEVEGDKLVVSGEKRFESDHSDGQYRVFECAYGAFRRSIRLPVKVLAEKAKASYRKGILEIELPKAEPARPRMIEVKVN